MESLRLLLVFLHLLGMATLLGGFLVQVRAPERHISTAMLHGALVQLVTGVALVGVRQALHEREPAKWAVDNGTWGVKLAVVLVVLVLVVANRRRRRVPAGGYWAIGLLSTVNVALAVFVQ